MEEITITESQRAELEAIRDDLESAFVETYGHVRLQDVIQYLVDTYTPPQESGNATARYERIAMANYSELQQVAADVPEIPGSGIDADTMRGQLLSTLGADDLAERLATLEPDEIDKQGNGTTSTSSSATEAETGLADDGISTPGAVSASSGSEESSDAGSETGGDSGSDGVLSAANQLLREHDDKWREAAGSDEPYEVTLPDGTTETARTKDDVRQLLFRYH